MSVHNFIIATPDPIHLYQAAVPEIRKARGTVIEQPVENGQVWAKFSVPTLAGTVAGAIIPRGAGVEVHIDKKPWVTSASLIESEIRKMVATRLQGAAAQIGPNPVADSDGSWLATLGQALLKIWPDRNGQPPQIQHIQGGLVATYPSGVGSVAFGGDSLQYWPTCRIGGTDNTADVEIYPPIEPGCWTGYRFRSQDGRLFQMVVGIRGRASARLEPDGTVTKLYSDGTSSNTGDRPIRQLA